jgi:outer membrane lipoprotein-sorting protein
MKHPLTVAYGFLITGLLVGGYVLADKPSKPSTDVTSEQAIDKLQKNWDQTASYQADFKQVIFAKGIGTRDESSGTVYVVKPSKLRWETPETGSTEILNGNKLYLIQEKQRRKTREVDVFPDVSKAVDGNSLSFLAGKAKFRDRYNVELLSEDSKQAQVKLTPKKGDGETLIAEIDKASYVLRSLTSESVDTRVRIDFSNVKANAELDDKLFNFKPKSTDIIHNQ